MLDVIDVSGCVVTRALTQGDEFIVATTAYDDAALEKNHVLRQSGILKNHKLSLHENEDTRAVISCPSIEQNMCLFGDDTAASNIFWETYR